MKLKKILYLVLVLLLVSCEVPQDMKKVNLGQNPTKDKVEEKLEDKDEGLSDKEWQDSMRDLTKGHTTLPTSEDIKGHYNSFLTPEQDCFKMFDDKNSTDNPSSKGARMLLASYYQSCKAIDSVITSRAKSLRGVSSKKIYDGKCGVKSRRVRNIYDMDAFVNSHIVLKEINKDPNYPAPGCIDKRKAPPVYGYCSAPHPRKDGTVKLASKGAGVSSASLPASGIDCSAFISLALGSQGLKVSKTDTKYKRYTTTGMSGTSKSSNSCLKSPKFSSDKTIIPGDIINYRASHVVMIDAVGDDPLGIKKHSKTNTCSSITIEDFDFTYIHSGLTGGNYGPSRVHIKAHNGQSTAMFNNMMALARKSCAKSIKEAEGVNSAAKIHSSDSRFGLLRHQSDDPNCRTEKKVKIEGQSCIEQCVEQG